MQKSKTLKVHERLEAGRGYIIIYLQAGVDEFWVPYNSIPDFIYLFASFIDQLLS